MICVEFHRLFELLLGAFFCFFALIQGEGFEKQQQVRWTYVVFGKVLLVEQTIKLLNKSCFFERKKFQLVSLALRSCTDTTWRLVGGLVWQRKRIWKRCSAILSMVRLEVRGM